MMHYKVLHRGKKTFLIFLLLNNLHISSLVIPVSTGSGKVDLLFFQNSMNTASRKSLFVQQMNGFKQQSRYAITDDSDLSHSGEGDRSNLPRRTNYRTTRMSRIFIMEKHTEQKIFPFFSHLRCSKWSIAEQIQDHQQWRDRGQVILAIQTDKTCKLISQEMTLKSL